MTILQALDRYYGRMAARGEAEAPGYSREKISFAIVLSPEGEPVDVVDLRVQSGRRLVPILIEVPAAVPRRVNILANMFWDKTEYSLGRSVEKDHKTPVRHATFNKQHRDTLSGSDDESLLALSRFLETREPVRFDTAPFSPDMLDTNIVFRFDGQQSYIHQGAAAQRLLANVDSGDALEFCLVTGAAAPTRRLHPTIKGVQGAQALGGALVSFNLDAFTSYGKAQGANAPVSEIAAFRYGAALNRMLDRDSPNRLRRTVGDATVAFCAEASDEHAAAKAEELFANWFDPSFDTQPDPETDQQAAAKLLDQLEKIAAGGPGDADPKLRSDTRFHVLGLAPNAARLSVRYWLDDDFSRFAARALEHARDLAIEPAPRGWGHKQPSVSRLLVKTTALDEKFENIPSLLAGEVMRAVLAGTRYPRTWLASSIIRLRAGDYPGTGWHAAVIRAVLERDRRLRSTQSADHGRDIPASLDRTRPDDPAYHLGRLFAALETAQRLALGNLNATIRDKYFGSASATPAGVFPLLLRDVQSHVGKLRKERKDGWIEREIGQIVDLLPPALPRSLKLDAQGRFAIGYYHQRQAQFAGRPKLAVAETKNEENPDE